MSAILLLAALACLVAIGWGIAQLRASPRGSLAGANGPERLRAWFGTLQGPRALGFGVAAAAGLAFLLILVLRP